MTQKRHIYGNKRELIADVVRATDTVLDIGFRGQGIQDGQAHWPHALLQATGANVYGVDLEIDRATFPDTEKYQEASAESFSFPATKFTIIFAGDLIEHLPNPGAFLQRCAEHLAENGVLILTTPNAFNLFNIAGKLTNDEPVVNKDHTCYFNHRTLGILLSKCGFSMERIGYVYSLEYEYRESLRKKFLNVVYWTLARFTPKFCETLVVFARPNAHK